MKMNKCQLCGCNKPEHMTEHLWNNGKRIVACQDCVFDNDVHLLGRFSCLTGIDYDRLMSA